MKNFNFLALGLLLALCLISNAAFGQPDLIITDVDFVQQANTNIGQTIQVKVIIKNNGNSNYAGSIVTGLEWLYDGAGLNRPNVELGGDDATWIGNVSVTGLNAGQSKTIYFSYIIADDINTTFLHAYIDHSKLITETNENNNDFVAHGYPSQPFGLWRTIHNSHTNNVPSLSQWALIILVLVSLLFGSSVIYRRRTKTV